MKFTRNNIEMVFKKTSVVKPSLMFRLKMHFRVIHAIKQQHISYFSGLRLLVPKAVSSSIAILIIMTSGITTMYAYNNPNITSGNPLYTLKIGVENIEKIIAFSPEKKANLFTKLANRRSEEAIAIANKTGAIDTEVISEIKKNNTQAIKHTKTITQSSTIEETKANLVTSSNIQKENLKKVKDIAVNKAIEDHDIVQDPFTLEDKNPIFLSAPVSMENISVRDAMLINEGEDDEFGIVLENDDSLVISGFSPKEDAVLSEEELIEEIPDIESVKSAIEKVEETSTKESLERVLEEETMFIN